jgi:acyl carrier protein
LDEIKEQVRSFVRTNFYVPEAVTLSDDSSLLEQGIIDSTGVLELVTFIEATFGIAVDDAEMVPQNLDSLQSISAFVDRKKEDLRAALPPR